MLSPFSRRSRAAAETRRLILAAAKDLYLEKGFRQAPSRELAKRAGVAEGTIFAHFPDKASLLAAALHEDLEKVLEKAYASLPRDKGCREQLLHLAGALYAYYEQRPELSRALVKESLFLEGEWGGRVVAAVLGFVSMVAELVRQAQARGEYVPDVDPNMAGRTFFAAYYMELTGALSEPEFDSGRALGFLEGHIRLWERGLSRAQAGGGR